MEAGLLNASVPMSPLTHVGKIAGTCTGKEEAGDAAKRARSCWEKGHASVFEHIALTWRVEGVSRALTHQLVRHRVASYTQQSQRYVKFGEFDPSMFVVPPVIDDDALEDFDGPAKSSYWKAMADAMSCYGFLIGFGIEAEDARYVLPNAMKTSVVVTMNLREFAHFHRLRTSPGAQWEIRALGEEMARSAKETLGGDAEWAELLDMILAEDRGGKAYNVIAEEMADMDGNPDIMFMCPRCDFNMGAFAEHYGRYPNFCPTCGLPIAADGDGDKYEGGE